MLRVRAVLGNSQRLDGGAMFGNAPKQVWAKWYPPDEQNRIALACRAVLVEDGARRVLLETGIGAFFSPRDRDRYGVVEPHHVLLDSLRAHGFEPNDIDVILLSHLHFDHAGGLLEAYEDGRPLRLAFPNANVVVGEEALARAARPHRRDRASFIDGLIPLLESTGKLSVVGSSETTSPLLGERFSLRTTSGHTPGMLHATITGRAQSVFFCADLVPGTAWVHLPITMGYDRYPEKLVDEKRDVLEPLARAGTWLAFTHDPSVAFATVKPDARGSFSVDRSRPDAAAALDLDAPDLA